MTRIEVAGSPVSHQTGTLSIDDGIDERAVTQFVVIDENGTESLKKGQTVSVIDDAEVTIWTGFLERVRRHANGRIGASTVWWDCLAVDNWYLADKRVLTKSYVNTLAGDIVEDIVNILLTNEGITFTAGSVEDGPLIKEAVFNWIPASRALKKLADIANFWVYIDKNKLLNFKARTSVAAPWTATKTDMLRRPELAETAPQYRNTQYVRGARTVTEFTVTDIKHGDGEARAFAVSYRVHTVSLIEVDRGGGFVSETIGVKGLDNGKKWYWSFNSETITQDTSETVLTSTDRVRVTFTGLLDIIVKTLSQDEIELRKAIEGVGTGIVDWVDQEPELRDKDAAFEWGIGRLQKFGITGRRLSFRTRRSGLEPGQLLTVDLTEYGLNSQAMLIDSVQTDDVNRLLVYRVSAVEGPEHGSWERFFGDIAVNSEIKTVRENLGEDETLILLKTFTRAWSPLANGGFDPDLTSWTEVIDPDHTATTSRATAESRTGAGSLEVDVTASSGTGFTGREQVVTGIVAGQVYDFQAFMKGSAFGGNTFGKLTIEWRQSDDTPISSEEVDSQDTAGSFIYLPLMARTAPALSAKVRVRVGVDVQTSGQTGKAWFDDVFIGSQTDDLPNIFTEVFPSADLFPSVDLYPSFASNDQLSHAEIEDQASVLLLRKILTTRTGLGTPQIKTMVFLNPFEAVGSVGDIVWFGGINADDTAGSGLEVVRIVEDTTKTALESWQVERTDDKWT